MSEAPVPNVGSSDGETDDQTIQRQWDRFAMYDHADGADPHDLPPAPTFRNPTAEAFAKRAFDSLVAHGATTPADVASFESSDSAREDTDADGDRGASS